MKKYVLGFSLEDKKFDFKTFKKDGKEYFKLIKLKGYKPDNFTFIKAKFEKDELILHFKAGKKGDLKEDLIGSSGIVKFKAEWESSETSLQKVSKKLTVIYHWTIYNDGTSNFAPETCGESILVGV